MGVLTQLECDYCGYKYEEDSLIFYWDKINKEIVVSPLTMLAHQEKIKTDLTGNVHFYYCYDCERFITYYEYEPRSKRHMKKLKDFINRYTEPGLKIINQMPLENECYHNVFDEHLHKEICPNCKSEVSILTVNSLCPNCQKGYLRAMLAINYV